MSFKTIVNLFKGDHDNKTYLPPCDKKDCMIYSDWELDTKYPTAYRILSKDKFVPPAETFCVACIHFNKFDLYRQGVDK